MTLSSETCRNCRNLTVFPDFHEVNEEEPAPQGCEVIGDYVDDNQLDTPPCESKSWDEGENNTSTDGSCFAITN